MRKTSFGDDAVGMKHSSVSGTTGGSWKKSATPVPKSLALKVGARVMTVRNGAELRWVGRKSGPTGAHNWKLLMRGTVYHLIELSASILAHATRS
jgi:hypothetical protein